jgi:hypothetical protein
MDGKRRPRHFLQSYSGVLTFAVKATAAIAVRKTRAALTAATER